MLNDHDLKQLLPPQHIVAVSVYLAVDAWTIEDAEEIAVHAVTVRVLSEPEVTDRTRLKAVRLLSRLERPSNTKGPERI